MQWLLDLISDGEYNIISIVIGVILSVIFYVGLGPIMDAVFELINQIMDGSYDFVLTWLYS